MKNKIRINKAELSLVCGLLIFAALMLCIMEFTATSGAYAVVYVDGEEWGRYRLSDDAETVISTEHGENTLVIKDGRADVTDADCPDKTCVRAGAAGNTGEMIVCLPHKVMVKIEGRDSEGRDSEGVDIELK